MRSTSEATGAFVTGWRRVLSAPRLVAGVWLATVLAALPAALAVKSAIAADLGASLVASRVAAGVDAGWWQEFQARAQAEAATLSSSVIGAAAPVANWSQFVDAPGVPPALCVAVAVGVGVWVFLSGGLIDRLARGRPIGTRAFFGACGGFFFRFLRLTVIVGAAYWLIASPFHVSDAPNERLATFQPANEYRVDVYGRLIDLFLLVYGVIALRILSAARKRSLHIATATRLAAVTVPVLALILWQVPYRLMYQSAFQRVDLEDLRCYRLGEDTSQVLLYCPDLAPPRSRLVRSTDPRLRDRGVFENIFMPASLSQPSH